MNPAAPILIVLGVLAVYIGVKGSQAMVWKTIDGPGVAAPAVPAGSLTA